MHIKLILSFFLAIGSFAQATEILLIRHGETDWNLEQRAQGRADKPLNATGIAQAEALALKMSKYHPDICATIYSSDLCRAVETAKKTAVYFRESTLVLNSDLREMDWGEIDGMLIAERMQQYREYEAQLKAQHPHRKERWNHPPSDAKGVETYNHLVERTKRALTQIALAHPEEKVAVFAHGRLINQLIIDLENLETDHRPGLPNCAVVHFYYDPAAVEQPLRFMSVEDLLNKE